MTRKTLLRHLLALGMLARGFPHVYYHCLPYHSKREWLWRRANLHRWMRAALEILYKSLELGGAISTKRRKIGDTIQVRMPRRFVGVSR